MWKDYSIGFIKKNRASSVSVMVAAFISTLFLSLLCGLFYNLWNYEIESVVLEEGNWQGRISGAFEEDEVSEIENFANVKTAIINEDLSDDQTLVVDICFDNMKAVYQDMPLIAQQLGIPECPCTSVWYLFQHWGNAGANSDLSFTGSGDALRHSYFAWKFFRNRFDVWNHPGSQCPRRGYCRQA